jgi:hypothetical protein
MRNCLRSLAGMAAKSVHLRQSCPEAEEEHATVFRIVIPVDEQKLLSAYVAEKSPILQLTVTVRDDS